MVLSEYEKKQSKLESLKWRKENEEKWIRFYKDKLTRLRNRRKIREHRSYIFDCSIRITQINEEMEEVQKYLQQFNRDIQVWNRIDHKKKRGRSYLRRMYCIYRLYRKHLSLDDIIKVLNLNPINENIDFEIDIKRRKIRRYGLHTRIQRYIGTAFKRECYKDQCFAKPFFEDPDYIPPSLRDET